MAGRKRNTWKDIHINLPYNEKTFKIEFSIVTVTLKNDIPPSVFVGNKPILAKYTA